MFSIPLVGSGEDFKILNLDDFVPQIVGIGGISKSVKKCFVYLNQRSC